MAGAGSSRTPRPVRSLSRRSAAAFRYWSRWNRVPMLGIRAAAGVVLGE